MGGRQGFGGAPGHPKGSRSGLWTHRDPIRVGWGAVSGFIATCETPTIAEWLVAAKNPAFVLSNGYEGLRSPVDDLCDFTQEDFDAEGVAGAAYFGGKGAQPGRETQVLFGGADPRSTVSVVSELALDFWAEDCKPVPMRWRCVLKRSSSKPKEMFVNASTLNVRAGRGADFALVEKVPIAAKVEVFHLQGEWAWVRVEGKGKGLPCRREGWVALKFLAERPPTYAPAMTAGRDLLKKGDANGAISELECAAALRPSDVPTLQLLLKAYEDAGKPAEATKLKRLLAKKTKKTTKEKHR